MHLTFALKKLLPKKCALFYQELRFWIVTVASFRWKYMQTTTIFFNSNIYNNIVALAASNEAAL